MTVTVFGNLISIRIDFTILSLCFLLGFSFDWEDMFKHERPCWTTFPLRIFNSLHVDFYYFLLSKKQNLDIISWTTAPFSKTPNSHPQVCRQPFSSLASHPTDKHEQGQRNAIRNQTKKPIATKLLSHNQAMWNCIRHSSVMYFCSTVSSLTWW